MSRPTELRRLFHLAWPSTLGMLAAQGLGFIDIVTLGRLGKDAVAGMALANTWTFSGLVLGIGGARALDPLVSQAWGAQDREAATLALKRNLLLLLPLTLGCVGWDLLTGPGLRLLGEPEAAVRGATALVPGLAASVLPLLAFQTVRQFVQSCGRVRAISVAFVVGTLVKVPMNLVLVFGVAGTPGLGIAGAGWATALAEASILVTIALLERDFLREMWPSRGRVVDVAALRRLAGLGGALGVQTGTELWAFATLTAMVGWLGETALAAHSVAINLASLVFMVPLGISNAASTRVGNLLGEGRAWAESARHAYTMGLGAALAIVAAFLLVPGALVALYTTDAAVVPVAVSVVGVAAALHLFDATQVITFGVLRGAGDVRMPTLANVLGYYVLGLPAAWWLGIRGDGGTVGLWWGLVLGQAVVVAVLLVRLRTTLARGGYRLATS